MRKRSNSLSPTRVAPITVEAFKEVYEQLGPISAVEFRLLSAAAYAGDVMTSYGKFSEVIAKEMSR